MGSFIMMIITIITIKIIIFLKIILILIMIMNIMIFYIIIEILKHEVTVHFQSFSTGYPGKNILFKRYTELSARCRHLWRHKLANNSKLRHA